MKAIRLMVVFTAYAVWTIEPLLADQVVMQNGDQYVGRVLSLTTNTLVLQNENLGNVTLPRSKITAILLGTATAAVPPMVTPPNSPSPPSLTPTTNSVSNLSAALRVLRSQTNLIQQVQSQFLGSAGPEANEKFNELLDGLSTGKITLSDLRAEARSVSDQLRALTKDLGPDETGELEGYLAILDGFLKETATVNATTNSSRIGSSTKPASPPVGP